MTYLSHALLIALVIAASGVARADDQGDREALASENSDWFAMQCWERLHDPNPSHAILSQALTDCRYAITFSGDPSSIAMRGWVHMRLGELPRAIADFSNALRVRPDTATVLYMRGKARVASGDRPGGQSDIAKATALLPQIADLIRLCGEPASCDALEGKDIRDWVRCDGGPPVFADELAAGCSSVLKTARLSTSQRVRALVRRGQQYLLWNARHDALRDTDEAIRLDASSVAAFVARGYIHYYYTRHAEAVAAYDEAIRLDPNSGRAHFYRGLSKREMNRFDQAITDFDRAIQIDNLDDQSYTHRGLTFARSGAFKRGIADYNRALRIDPTNASAIYYRSEAYAKLGDSVRVVRDFQRAVRLDPRFGEDRD